MAECPEKPPGKRAELVRYVYSDFADAEEFPIVDSEKQGTAWADQLNQVLGTTGSREPRQP